MSSLTPLENFARKSCSLKHHPSTASDEIRFGLPMLSTLYFATAVPALASHSLFERQLTCEDPNYNNCPQSGLPSNFCCPQGQTCIALAVNTTLLCCPSAQNCTFIAPISCDIYLQNATLHPDSTLKTTAFLRIFQGVDQEPAVLLVIHVVQLKLHV